MTQQLDDGRLNPSKTPCFWREIVAAANSLRPHKQTNYADLKKTKAAFLYEAVQLLLTNIFTLKRAMVKREWGRKFYLKHYDCIFYPKLLYSFTIISQIKETRQSDKSPVERNTQERKILVRYMAFVFH